MKLLYSPTSPYARKARIVAREKRLLGRVEEVISLPADKPAELLAANPLGKVPALILDDSSVLFDSPVICEYLDQLTPDVPLIPNGPARWPVLRAQALADGMVDVAVLGVMEKRRPPELQLVDRLEHLRTQMRSAVRQMPQELTSLGGELNMGHIAIAAALGYLDLRHPDLEWRGLADASLVTWYAEFSGRQSMQDTEPPA